MNGRDNGCAAENGSVMSGQKKKKVEEYGENAQG